MLRREKVHALILSRHHIGEADRSLTLFTKDYGLLRVIAKGVRKIPSRRGGHLEPLSHIMAILSGRSGHYYLAAVETIDDYPALRQDTEAQAVAYNLASVVQHLFEEDEPQPSLFDAVHHAFGMLPTLEASKRHLLEVAVAFLALKPAGWVPRLTSCLRCHTITPADAVVLDSTDGGWRCLSCHTSFSGTRASVSPRLLKALKFIVRYPERSLQLAITDEESVQLVIAIRNYVATVTGAQLVGETDASFIPSVYAPTASAT